MVWQVKDQKNEFGWPKTYIIMNTLYNNIDEEISQVEAKFAKLKEIRSILNETNADHSK